MKTEPLAIGSVYDDIADPFNPNYYTSGGLEAIDVIRALDLMRGFCLGNAIKYIWRAGKKANNDETDDIGKAMTYLAMYTDYLNDDINEADRPKTD